MAAPRLGTREARPAVVTEMRDWPGFDLNPKDHARFYAPAMRTAGVRPRDLVSLAITAGSFNVRHHCVEQLGEICKGRTLTKAMRGIVLRAQGRGSAVKYGSGGYFKAVYEQFVRAGTHEAAYTLAGMLRAPKDMYDVDGIAVARGASEALVRMPWPIVEGAILAEMAKNPPLPVWVVFSRNRDGVYDLVLKSPTISDQSKIAFVKKLYALTKNPVEKSIHLYSLHGLLEKNHLLASGKDREFWIRETTKVYESYVAMLATDDSGIRNGLRNNLGPLCLFMAQATGQKIWDERLDQLQARRR